MKLLRLLVLLACASGPACTLAKPLVGTLVTPVVYTKDIYEEFDHWFGATMLLLHALPFAIVVAPFAGLVNGVESDYAVLVGRSKEATRNWWNPFLDNVDSRSAHLFE